MMKQKHRGSFPFASPHNKEGIAKEPAACPSSAIGSSLQSNDADFSEVETAALRALKEGISNTPHEEKSSLVHVQRVNPDLVDDAYLLGYLRVEGFNVDLALKRLLRYWEHRLKVFGPDKFSLPMTLNGAMKGRIDALKQGFLTLLPVLDDAGRAIIYSSSSPYKQLNPHPDEKIQVWWYLMHVAMENPAVAEKGFVILTNSRDARLNNFDGKWALAACSSGDRDFPIRWISAHVCHANAVFPFVASALKAIMSPKQRESLMLHNGSNATVLESLAEYSLPKHCVPTDLGGSLRVSAEAFVRERLAIEGGVSDFDTNNEESSSRSQDSHTSQVHEMEEGANSVLETVSSLNELVGSCDNQNDGTPSSSTPIEAESSNANKATIKSALAPPILENKRKASAVPGLPAQQKQKNGKSSLDNIRQTPNATKKDKKDTAHPGRSGDPRMNRAVQAKLDDPDLPLFAALVAGGFVFPDSNAPGVKLSDAKDTDNVTVYQRRNQLLRRLRLAKGKAADLGTGKEILHATKKEKKGKTQKVEKDKKAKNGKLHSGRSGDPRMNRAVQAKLDDPDMPLFAALVAGGFVFPDINAPGVKLSDAKDTDNVTVYQRRNQLLRRLRRAKEQVDES